MAFVIEVNPFTGILCMPYYDIWILIIISWILAWIEVAWVAFIDQCRQKILKQKGHLLIKENIEIRIRSKFKQELSKIVIENVRLPDDIISIIMDMIPRYYRRDCWKRYKQKYIKSIERKAALLSITVFVYPIMRIIVTFLDFIMILIHYGHWYYKDNNNLSDWSKYCAFIIALFYMPNFKGRGTHSMWMLLFKDRFWNNPMIHSISEYNQCGYLIQRVAWIGITADLIFAILFVIVSSPIFISGIFVYLPQTIGAVFIVSWLYILVAYVVGYVDEGLGAISGAIVATSLVTMCFFIMIIVGSMELYNGENWWKAYMIAYDAEYCNETDYFQFSKWNEYPLDIQFLIISWFLF